ncbi:MAG TPA: peptidoglycan-binding domain-containing protein [Solirubrobacteraceae bacterium]|nr:peptidoglycan-binding domain-containing protein [Solirubrobacteraceae bacterium]
MAAAALGATSAAASATAKHAAADPPASGGAAMAATVKTAGTLNRPSTFNQLGRRILRPGLQGNDVTVLQGYLTIAGYPTSVDGDFGPDTGNSVAAFKQAHDITPANDVAGLSFDKVLKAAISAEESDVPTGTTRINADGTATAPAGAPAIVQTMVSAANSILDSSYCVGGGHGTWNSSCYDCSGSVSFVLHAAGLLSQSEDSTGLESFGVSGPGKWVSIYSDPSHAFIVIGGRAFDTADYGGPNIPAGTGPRWRSNPLGNLADGGDYVVRHPAGL